jgi:hypothetical protein
MNERGNGVAAGQRSEFSGGEPFDKPEVEAVAVFDLEAVGLNQLDGRLGKCSPPRGQ